jgi:subtilisin family serine protease
MPTEPENRRGRGVCVGIVDSGVHVTHPHVRGIAGGIGMDADGVVSADYVDRIGHGTAVTAAIREKAPAADCYAIRIFETRLSASAATLIAAIDWAVFARVHVINLSLGTSNTAHEPAFAAAVARASAAGVAIVAARDDDGVTWLPGSLPGVIQVQTDWECPRDRFRITRVDGQTVFRASGFARPISGVDPRRNLHGISFAVANVTGFLACALSAARGAPPQDALVRLAGA